MTAATLVLSVPERRAVLLALLERMGGADWLEASELIEAMRKGGWTRNTGMYDLRGLVSSGQIERRIDGQRPKDIVWYRRAS